MKLELREETLAYGTIVAIALDAAGQQLAVALGALVVVYDLRDGTRRHELRVAEPAPTDAQAEVADVAFSPDARQLLVSAETADTLFDLEDGSVRAVLGHAGDDDAAAAEPALDRIPGAATFSPDGAAVAACTEQGVALWDAASARVRWHRALPGGGDEWAPAFRADGARLAVAHDGCKQISVLDARDGAPLAQFATGPIKVRGPLALGETHVAAIGTWRGRMGYAACRYDLRDAGKAAAVSLGMRGGCWLDEARALCVDDDKHLAWRDLATGRATPAKFARGAKPERTTFPGLVATDAGPRRVAHAERHLVAVVDLAPTVTTPRRAPARGAKRRTT